MSKLDDHIKAVSDKIIAHAEKYPLGDIGGQVNWRSDFKDMRADIECLRYARGLIQPVGGSFPLNT